MVSFLPSATTLPQEEETLVPREQGAECPLEAVCILWIRENLFLLLGIAPQFCDLPFSSSVTTLGTLNKLP